MALPAGLSGKSPTSICKAKIVPLFGRERLVRISRNKLVPGPTCVSGSRTGLHVKCSSGVFAVKSNSGFADLASFGHRGDFGTPSGLGVSSRFVCKASSRSFQALLSEDENSSGKEPGILEKIKKALRNFGFGRTSLWEGGVGLFLLAGAGLLFALYSWIKGSVVGKSFSGYQAVIEFPKAYGITVGTPVRVRGVPVGSVMNVRPSLESVDVLVEIQDSKMVIPRNSVVEANQSGLIAEPLIDITPQLPIPDYKASPLDSKCEEEGAILCNKGRMQGVPGVALDDLVYVCTKLARQMDEQGMDSMFDAAKSASELMQEAKPLLNRAVALSEAVTPFLNEVNKGDMVKHVESLTASASQAAADIQKLQREVLTKDNVQALNHSVLTLAKTLENIESISGSMGSVVADRGVQTNMRQLVEALSRMVGE
uniref:Atp-binding cassette superfamily n=1 Tax=Tetraselmis sp. GSL018 TaxID=582737 RepID=A0A061RFD7_9CHLO|mmetsp:Transcript_30997/g.73701  ORF Transcript_30997/g.73701 Transcript_30997/m.73701 type:complete len:426 (+) Transcript_30997:131-1408(+)|eukprot:CAMPEP_0177588346 /NCGR_PEP_ID=MMETSP0419_2-20121207/6174_1 /TAXON_ID=582737 /ORGANISM="Tetraselmis sp., Strain GSL018" /LENGTH=425 /DNA_ID=CAMNT_0019078533 /DNA_START=64 /DNA_END=1341 /DNA_ORIENTATION=+